jgi:hypothetical protein
MNGHVAWLATAALLFLRMMPVWAAPVPSVKPPTADEIANRRQAREQVGR